MISSKKSKANPMHNERSKIAKTLAILTTIIMTLTMMPMTASAAGEDGIAQVSCGNSHTGILKTDSTLWMTGLNDNGELGDGTTEDKYMPVKVMEDVQQISCGENYTGILKTDGTLWMMGENQFGQLGDGTTESKSTPVKVMEDVQQVNCSAYHTGILKTDGTLWMMGNNSSGQLGDGTIESKSTPVKVMEDVQQVSCGAYHTGILKTDGTLWMSGTNDYGERGDDTTGDISTPVKVMEDVQQVSCGGSSTGILKTNGTLWMSGDNYYGQLGDGTTEYKYTPVKVMEDVQQVSCGWQFTGILKTDGTLWMTGINWFGQLGDGTTESKSTPVKVMEDVQQVSCGGNHTGILKKDGTLWMTGNNSSGELGDGGDTLVQYTPVKITLGGSTDPAVLYNITFKPNGGKCSIATKSVTSGEACGELPTPTWSGYYFNGWYTQKSGGQKINASTVITKNITVYAHWIKKKSLAKATVKVNKVTYDGTAQMPSVTVTIKEKTLKKGTDFKVTYSNNINASKEAVAKITGINKYKGTISKNFTIKPHSMSKASGVDGSLSKTSIEYTGKAITPRITMYFNGKKMIKDKDYTVSYSANKKIGTAHVMVNGKGNFVKKGRLFSFKITRATQPFKLSKSSITVRHRNIGSTTTITVSGVKEFASVTATSSNSKVATVSKTVTGKFEVKSKGVGTAKISFKTKKTSHYKATTKTLTVTVKDRKDAGLKVSSNKYDLDTDDGPFNLGATRAGNGKITYSISAADKAKKVATVDAAGNVTLMGNEGTITITITSAATQDYKKETVKVSITVSDKNKLYWPVRWSDLTPITEISSHPGDTVAGNAHRGIDISDAEGAGWYAAYGGTVIYVFRGCITNGNNSHAGCSPNHPELTSSSNSAGVVCNNGFGNGCIIKSEINGKTYYFQYAHMDSVSDSLVEGMQITKGTYLGQVGDKGFSFGTHAHFEIDEETSIGSYWGRPTDNDPESPQCEFDYKY